jgi:hypothetical protein
MDDKPKAPAIEPQGYLGGVNVVDFGDLRVSRGLSRRPFTTCPHKQLVYDQRERRIWCKDCECDVEAFDAFEQLVTNLDKGWKEVMRRVEKVEEAEAHSLISVAAKVVDDAWRKKNLSPCCPHCMAVLLPEDFSKGIVNKRGTELERQRRKNDSALPHPNNGE